MDADGADVPSQPEAPEGAPTPPPPVDADAAPRAIEAILITSDRPVPAGRLAHALGLGEGKAGERAVLRAVEALNREYEAGGRAFRVETIAGGLRVVTVPEVAPVLASYHGARASNRLSKAGVETLAVIAYRQPVTRAEIESIRGVACGEVLRSLMDRRLITIVGRAEELGRPMLYGTTKQFLEQFGLGSVKDLPSPDESPALADAPARPVVEVRRSGPTPPAPSDDAPQPVPAVASSDA